MQHDFDWLKQQIERLSSPDRQTRTETADLLLTHRDTVLDLAIAGLKDPSPKVRRNCADLMDHLGDRRCVQPLIELLNDPVPVVRWQALHSLSCERCKPEPLNIDLGSLLIKVLKEEDNRKVRGMAAYMLGFQPLQPQSIPALEAVIAEFDGRDWARLSKTERLLLRNAREAIKRLSNPNLQQTGKPCSLRLDSEGSE
jgi:HEAT repeat protein